ncbi:MAG: molybdopterin-synthase adenylyltransferase MoeB [Thermoplasmata archaeon]
MGKPTVTVRIPTPLRQYVEDRDSLDVEGGTVQELLDGLIERYRPLKRYLLGDDGKLRNFVNVYVNDQDIRYLEREATSVAKGDTVIIVPSVAGGVFPNVTLGPRPSVPLGLSQEEIKRYSRHLILPEVGLEGQEKLRRSSALIVGVGGLGAPLGMYLTAAGIGRLGLVDFDAVEESNLQRQVLFDTNDLTRPKLKAAQDRLEALNPGVQVDTHEVRLTSDNALEILGDYDVIIDGTDNFPTRYLVNDASVLLGKPNVYGSIFRFEGQVSVFDAAKGPCYRCLYREPPPPGLVPSCAEGGVLGVLPGVVGSLQAVEALKVLLGKGDTLVGRLLLFDAMRMSFRELRLRKDPACPVCGENPTVTELIDYEAFCGVTEENALPSEFQLDVGEAAEMVESGNAMLLDVREPVEWQIAHIEGARLMPVGEVPYKVGELSTADNIIVHCHTGARSAHITQFLRELGFTRVWNMAGGIDAWARKVDPDLPRY